MYEDNLLNEKIKKTFDMYDEVKVLSAIFAHDKNGLKYPICEVVTQDNQKGWISWEYLWFIPRASSKKFPREE
jgi:hypothetical protein